VNALASHVKAAGRSRRWISADKVKGVLRWPHSNRSLCRRLEITTYASTSAVLTTSAKTSGPGSVGKDSSRSPMASPRSVTGASTIH
jgi:hypothetical protein